MPQHAETRETTTCPSAFPFPARPASAAGRTPPALVVVLRIRRNPPRDSRLFGARKEAVPSPRVRTRPGGPVFSLAPRGAHPAGKGRSCPESFVLSGPGGVGGPPARRHGPTGPGGWPEPRYLATTWLPGWRPPGAALNFSLQRDGLARLFLAVRLGRSVSRPVPVLPGVWRGRRAGSGAAPGLDSAPSGERRGGWVLEPGRARARTTVVHARWAAPENERGLRGWVHRRNRRTCEPLRLEERSPRRCVRQL